MKSRPLSLLLGIALTVIGLDAASAWAKDQKDQNQKELAVKTDRNEAPTKHEVKNDANTLPGSVRRIQRETGGQVLKAQPIQRDGREVYRVKVVTPQGRVRVMEDDAGPAPQAPPPVEREHRR